MQVQQEETCSNHNVLSASKDNHGSVQNDSKSGHHMGNILQFVHNCATCSKLREQLEGDIFSTCAAPRHVARGVADDILSNILGGNYNLEGFWRARAWRQSALRG